MADFLFIGFTIEILDSIQTTFEKNLDVHLRSSFAQCKCVNKKIKFEYV